MTVIKALSYGLHNIPGTSVVWADLQIKPKCQKFLQSAPANSPNRKQTCKLTIG